jgi:hypothetical protein
MQSNWLSKILPRKKSITIFKKVNFLPDDSSNAPLKINEEYLTNLGLPKESLTARIIEVETLQEYLQENQVESSGIAIKNNLEIKKEYFILAGRTIILMIISVQMLIIPFRLLSLFENSFYGKVEMSEKMQIAILSAVAGDLAGLYYIVTRDLFPKGGNSRQKDDNNSEDETNPNSQK